MTTVNNIYVMIAIGV